MSGVNYTGGNRNSHIRRKPDTSGRTQTSRFATNSRESEAAARKLVGSMKKDAKGWLVEQKRKTRPTFDFTFAPQSLPTAVEPEEIDEIEDADDDVSRGVRSIDLELERRNKVESSRILSRLEAMDPSSTAATRRALLAKSDWVGTRSRLTTSSSRPKQPVNLTKSALRPSRVPYSAPDINPPPSSLPSFPADHRRPTPDSLQVAYRSPSPSPPPQPPQRSEFAQSFYDAQAMAEDYPAQRGDFEADEGGGCYDEFGYEMNDVQGGSDYGEYTREQRNDRSWEREDTQEFDYTPSDSDSILDFPDEDHHSMDVAYSRPSSPQLVYEHDHAFIFTTYEAEDEVGMQWEPTREEEKVLGERMGLGCTGGTREQMGRWEEGMVGRWEKEWASDWDYEAVPDEGWAGILARSRGDDASAEEQVSNDLPAPIHDSSNPPTTLSRISSLASPSPPPIPRDASPPPITLYSTSQEQPLHETSPSAPSQDVNAASKGLKNVAGTRLFDDDDLKGMED